MDLHDSLRKHDEQTELCLGVHFEPYYFSTHGLSRPGSPSVDRRQRYWSLIADAVDDSQIAPISDECFANICSHVPKHLLRLRGAMEEFVREMTEDHNEAIKRGMLDYVLMDSSEQQRLGVPVPDKVQYKYSPNHRMNCGTLFFHSRPTLRGVTGFRGVKQ